MVCIKCQKAIPEDGLYCPYCGKKQQAQKRKKKKRVNGSGSVCRKPGNRSKPWEAQKAGVYIGAYATKYEAEQALLRLADLPISETLNLTFEQVYQKWFPEHSRTITAKGAEGYATAYKHCQSLYPRIFRKLRTSDFQGIIMEMEEKGLSNASCAKVLQLFGQLSAWAIREEICHTDYSRFVQLTPQQKTEKRVFSAEQIAALQSSALPAAKIALLLIATGCRPNELFSVPLSNCFGSYFISGSKTEAGRNRIIPVSALGLPAYQSLLASATQNGCAKLIDAYAGNHTYSNFAKRDWKELMASLGIEGMTPYNCRHTFATLAVKSGVKPEILQRILGHSDYNTTATIYTHLDIAAILEESKKVTVTDTLQTPEKQPI
jgi:integrase